MECGVRIKHNEESVTTAFGFTETEIKATYELIKDAWLNTKCRTKFAEMLWETLTERQLVYFIATFGSNGVCEFVIKEKFADSMISSLEEMMKKSDKSEKPKPKDNGERFEII